MESRIGELKNDFNNIIHIRSTVKSIFDILEQRIEKLKNLYSDFIQHNENQLFIFGLDSFRFQSKLIDIEYEDMMRLFLAINNRMYCEYFKLYKIIIEYIFQNITDKKITEVIKVNNFPVYKDLEPYKEYKFEIVLDLHENILVLLSSIINNIDNKENELLIYQNKKKIGLSIDNFVTSFNYDIIMMKEKVILFLTYIEFFHQLHTKYLKRFSNKIQLMYTHINNDILFDESLELNADKQHEILSEFTHSNIDKQLLSDLKRTINVETNSDSGSERGSGGTPASSEYGNESVIMSPTGSSSHSHHNRTNSFLGFCDNNNILLAPIPANDKMAHAFGMIESSCESILKNDKEEIYNNLIRNTSQGRVGKEEGPSKAKMLLKEEAKRRLEAKRLEEEAAAKEEEESKRLEEEKERERIKLAEQEIKRLEEEQEKERIHLEQEKEKETEKERIRLEEEEKERIHLEQEEKEKERIRLEEEEKRRLEEEKERILLEEEELKRLEEEKERKERELAQQLAQQLEEEARQIAEAKRLEEEQRELQRQQEEESKRLEEQNTQPIE